jgi:predicted regulator of Ras-like GTPase activity (Roadblock/LC7/MglB family)
MNIPPPVKSAIEKECQRLINELDGIICVVIASTDGFDVGSAVKTSLDPAKIAAMASSIIAIGSVVSQEATLGNSKSVMVNTEDGLAYMTYIHVMEETFILNIIANHSALLAQVIYQCSETSKRLKAL